MDFAATCLTEGACAQRAAALSLTMGGGGYAFSSTFPYYSAGCYSYSSGDYEGMAFFGTGGTDAEMGAALTSPKYRVTCTEDAAPTTTTAPSFASAGRGLHPQLRGPLSRRPLLRRPFPHAVAPHRYPTLRCRRLVRRIGRVRPLACGRRHSDRLDLQSHLHCDW